MTTVINPNKLVVQLTIGGIASLILASIWIYSISLDATDAKAQVNACELRLQELEKSNAVINNEIKNINSSMTEIKDALKSIDKKLP